MGRPGTGIVARLAKERLGVGGSVVRVDVSPPMLAVARSLAPDIDWREGNANALPIQDTERFDVLICQQGLQFFPDKPAAAREMRRALVTGGRLALATWRPNEDISLLQDLHRVAERHLGAILDQRHSFGNPAALATLLTEAGFKDVRVENTSRPIRFADGSVFWRLNSTALVGMSAASKGLSDEERARVVAAIVSDSAAALEPYSNGEGLMFQIASNVATARG